MAIVVIVTVLFLSTDVRSLDTKYDVLDGVNKMHFFIAKQFV